jgi:hypothetical protein
MYQKMLRNDFPRDGIFAEMEGLRNSAMHVADDLGKFLETPHSDFGHSNEDFKAANLANGGEVEIPRATDIGGQPHMLAYINPEEEDLLQDYRGDAPVGSGPGDIPAYIFHTSQARDKISKAVSNFFSGGSNNTSSSSSNNNSSSGMSDYEREAFGMPQEDFYNNQPTNTITTNYNDDDDDDRPAPQSYVDTSSLEGISAASGIDYTGGNTNTITTNYDGGYESEAYPGGSQAGFYNDGGFGTDTDSENTDSDNVTVVTGSSGYPSLDATAGSYTGGNTNTGSSYVDTSTLTGISDASGTDYTGGDTNTSTNTGTDSGSTSVYVPPPTYYDMYGGEHSTQEAANAADKAYSDAQQTALDVASQTDGQAGYMSGGYEYAGPDIDLDQGQQQSEASNNTAKLMNDYSTISDDYSTFQGNDLTPGS